MHKTTQLAATLCLALTSGGCSSNDDDTSDKDSKQVQAPPGSPSSESLSLDDVSKLLDTNADIALAAYGDSVRTAEALADAIDAFEAEPVQANFDAAKRAWLVSREPYGQTEVFRFRNSPIDSTDYESEDGPEGDINAWPLGEALIDYVVTNESDFGTDQVGVSAHSTEVHGGQAIDATVAETEPMQNIIGTAAIVINEALLSGTATADDEHDVIAGYHAIEFLLWGQDLNDNGEPTVGDDRENAVKTLGAPNLAAGGQRPLEDFTTNANADRRFAFLKVATAKLISDLKQVRDGWQEGADYRKAFTQVADEDEAKQRLTEILTGMGTLSEGELAGERMQIAFSANSQEDEHSCFSDNTHRDIWLNAEGVKNSFYGDYAGYDSTLDGEDDAAGAAVEGYGIQDLLQDSGHGELAGKLKDALMETQKGYQAIDEAARAGEPFDVQIQSTSSEAVIETIIALNAQAAVISEMARALGLGEVVDPEASACDTTDPTGECP